MLRVLDIWDVIIYEDVPWNFVRKTEMITWILKEGL